MRPSTRSVRTAGADRPAPPEPDKRRLSRRLWAIVGALGILGTVGGYLTNLALSTAHDRLTEPLKVDVRDTTSSPNDLFPTGTSPQTPRSTRTTCSGRRSAPGPSSGAGVPYQDVSEQLILRGGTPRPSWSRRSG